MGFVRIQSMHFPYETLTSSFLASEGAEDENVTDFHFGDMFYLTLQVEDPSWISLLEITSGTQGVRILKDLALPSELSGKVSVEMLFKIIERGHAVCRDWMHKSRIGFRDAGTTIVVEPLTEEVEKVFVFLEERFQEFRKLEEGNHSTCP